MYAIEFRAKIKNGIIAVPPEYRNRLKENVKVIVITEGKEPTSNMIETLLDSPLKVKNFISLTREEIYERQ